MTFRELMAAWLAAVVFLTAAPLGALMLRMIAILTGGDRRPGIADALDSGLARTFTIWIAGAPIIITLTVIAMEHGGGSGYGGPLAAALRLAVILAGCTVLLRFCQRERLTQVRAAIGLLFYAIALTLLGSDLQLSLEAEWLPQGIAMTWGAWLALAGAAIAVLHADRGGARRDLGGLLAGATIAAIYFAFIDYFVVWYADNPEKTRWYELRTEGVWTPFVALAAMAALAGLVLVAVGRFRAAACFCLGSLWLYLVWWLAPAGSLTSAAVAAVLTAGGIALSRRRSLRPTRKESALG